MSRVRACIVDLLREALSIAVFAAIHPIADTATSVPVAVFAAYGDDAAVAVFAAPRASAAGVGRHVAAVGAVLAAVTGWRSIAVLAAIGDGVAAVVCAEVRQRTESAGVPIAVFAVFCTCNGDRWRVNAEFKPVCGGAAT